MFSTWRIRSVSIAGSMLALLAVNAHAVPLLDTYLGGADHGYGDVIGNKAIFDTHRAEIVRTSDRLTVDIYTNFVGNVGVFASLTRNGKGIGYGDLLLGGAWQPFVKPGDTSSANTEGHLFDNALNGTRWRYALSFDDPWSTATSGRFSFYELTGSNLDNLILTEELFKSNAIVRDGQAVQVDRNSPTVNRLGGGDWIIDLTPGSKRLSFDLDLSLDPHQQLAAWEYLSLHWGMTCNNDAIEGGVSLPSVPEPTTWSLLGLGMLGLGSLRRAGARRVTSSTPLVPGPQSRRRSAAMMGRFGAREELGRLARRALREPRWLEAQCLQADQ